MCVCSQCIELNKQQTEYKQSKLKAINSQTTRRSSRGKATEDEDKQQQQHK